MMMAGIIVVVVAVNKMQTIDFSSSVMLQVHKLTLCQAEVLHKKSRLGAPMTEEQIEEMKHKMTSLKPYHMPMPVKKFENGIPVENK